MPDDSREETTRRLVAVEHDEHAQRALLGQGKYAEAEPLVVPVYEGMKAREAKIPAHGKPVLAEAAKRVVRLYEGWGRPEQTTAWKVKLDLAELPADLFAK